MQWLEYLKKNETLIVNWVAKFAPIQLPKLQILLSGKRNQEEIRSVLSRAWEDAPDSPCIHTSGTKPNQRIS